MNSPPRSAPTTAGEIEKGMGMGLKNSLATVLEQLCDQIVTLLKR